MGASSSKKSPVIGSLAYPMYCLDLAGSRHMFLAGGGGAAKTGVKNEIQTMLLGYDTNISHASAATRIPTESVNPRVRNSGSVDTFPYSTMDMDVISFGQPEDGRYLIATSHDNFCDIYETDGFEVVETENEPRTLSLIPRQVAHFETIFVMNEKKDKYQKRVKFANLNGKMLLLTSGSDGMIKTWNVEDLLQKKETYTPVNEWEASDGLIEDLDVSTDGSTVFSFGGKSKSVFVWDTASGRQLYEVQSPPGYTPRSVRFTNRIQDNERDNVFFVVAYNPTIQRGKQPTKLLRWVCSRRQTAKDLVCSTNTIPERISKIDVQQGGRWIAIGTMEGSVAVHRTNDLKAMKVNIGTHDSFVTGIKVLPSKTEDFPQLEKSLKMPFIPGPHSEAEVAVVTVSVDNTVQLHALPYDHSPSLIFVALLSLILTILCPVLFSLVLKVNHNTEVTVLCPIYRLESHPSYVDAPGSARSLFESTRPLRGKTSLRTHLLRGAPKHARAGLTRGDMDQRRLYHGTSAKPPFPPLSPIRSVEMNALELTPSDFEEISLHTETPLLHTVTLASNLSRKQYVTFADPVHIQISCSEKERRLCRICQSEVGALVRPCGCSGTMADVHEDCLNEWIVQSSGNRICGICQQEYATAKSTLPPCWRWTKPNFECKNFAELFMVVGLGFSLLHLISATEDTTFPTRVLSLKQEARPGDVTRLLLLFIVAATLAVGLLNSTVKIFRYVTKQRRIRFVNAPRQTN
ncbi:hypothetical protein QR680_018097 [Steinernema hermaphroditum]|uniref:RING-CH-type domain-containing protein n=1 Tax=Steinernema hermaphroditum TaxID=289476 RepID=A0AA39HHU5_9BILA|nr:hypothetical protein QR680_018097 [Steinernema hermaphroditum]